MTVAMRNWIWIVAVVVLSAVALGELEQWERKRAPHAESTTGSSAVVILVGFDDAQERCGVVYSEHDIPVVSRRLSSVLSALSRYTPEDGLTNPMQEHGVSLLRIRERRTKTVVDLVGEPLLGGLCDAERLREQIARTVALYEQRVEIRLNGRVDQFECMPTVTGGCA